MLRKVRILVAVAVTACLGSALAGTQSPRCAVSAGQKAPSFVAKTVDGEWVHFPSDYKGKVVLLDFWATWCKPCREELPNVTAVYRRFCTNGFDVLSVSLDAPRQGLALLRFLRQHGMTWPQIYDGHYMKAAVAVKYGVQFIPCPVLVNGDTGVVIASGVGALGEHLPELVEKSLAAQGRKVPELAPYDPNAPGKVTVVINGQTVAAWRARQLASAKKAAVAEHKPIAWIISDPKYLDGFGAITSRSSRGATLHAMYALRDKAVLVFEAASLERNSVPPVVDSALGALHAHYYTPVIVFLDSGARHALAAVTFQPDFMKRGEALVAALNRIKGKF